MRVIMSGPPGAGKGTQAQLLSAATGFVHISTGDLFRKHVGEGTELGTAAQKYMSAGELVPDSVTVGMVAERLDHEDAQRGFILDGFPRNVEQAIALDKMLESGLQQIIAVFDLRVSEDAVIERLGQRGRGDDSEPVVRNRLRVYHAESEPVLEHYGPVLFPIVADRPIDEVHRDVLAALAERYVLSTTA